MDAGEDGGAESQPGRGGSEIQDVKNHRFFPRCPKEEEARRRQREAPSGVGGAGVRCGRRSNHQRQYTNS